MAILRMMSFAGMSPRVAPHLLQDNEAQNAINTRLTSGELRPWRSPADQGTSFPDGTKTIFKGKNSASADVWYSWTSDVDVVKSPIFDTTDYRIYYTGDGAPKKTNKTLAGSAYPYPAASLNLGVPAPLAAPTVTLSGSASGTPDSRVYVYTYVSTFGSVTEESGPSPASTLVSHHPGQTVTLSGFSTAPTSGYNITHIRIYRSVTGTSSSPFLLVAEVAVGTSTYVDSVAAADLGEVIPSASWSEPPSGLKGLIAHPSGFLAGFVDNRLFFSEPFQPHAWNLGNSLTVEFPIVGIGIFGETFVVVTTANPYLVTGAAPESMSAAKMPGSEPCVSKRSIVSDETGVMYASPNGVVLVNSSGSSVTTKNIFTREEWKSYFPQTMLGKSLDGRYHLFYEDGVRNLRDSIILDRYNVSAPLSKSTVYATAAAVDPEASALFVIQDDDKLYRWDSDTDTNPYLNLPYEWRSKRFIVERPVSFGAVQCDADFESVAEFEAYLNKIKDENQAIWAAASGLQGALNEVPLNHFTLNGSLLKDLPSSETALYVRLTAYADGVLRYTVNLINRDAIRLPGGFKADRWEFVLTGNIPLRFVKVSSTINELKVA